MKNLTRIGGVTAVVAALALTACGGGGGKTTGPESGKGQECRRRSGKLISINAKDAKDLQPGGTVTLPLGNIGPDFNGVLQQRQHRTTTPQLHYPIDEARHVAAGSYDFDGHGHPQQELLRGRQERGQGRQADHHHQDQR